MKLDVYTQVFLHMCNGFSLYDAILKELRLCASVRTLSQLQKTLYEQYPSDHDSIDRAITKREDEIRLAYK